MSSATTTALADLYMHTPGNCNPGRRQSRTGAVVHYTQGSFRTESQEHALMSDNQSNSVVPDENDDTNKLYELIEVLHGVRPAMDSEGNSAEPVANDEKNAIFHSAPEDENWTYPEQSTNYPNINPYEAQYHMQHMHLSSVLERGLSGIHSELCQLSRSVLQLAYGMKECADTMGFYTTRMLAFQKEMINTTSQANISLHDGVHLLKELMAKHEPRLADNSNNRDGKSDRSDESNSKRRYRDIQPRSPDTNGSRYSKRHLK
ncbi:uncharacterized protein [Dendrobates tinctorius]|uniref:uncharacterized protein isoform X2 n=1 Tax=Dendrobates tinctorius TaxID=92724 RepID=UPI003CC9E7A2